MENWIIYHNPQCSKSRESLQLLRDHGIEPKIIEYLKQPLTEVELLGLLEKLKLPASTLVRTKEELYRDLNFDLNSTQEVIKNIIQYPKLLERPLIVKNNSAVIGRPPENIKKLIL